MTNPIDFQFSSTQTTSNLEFSSTQCATDFGFESVVKIGDGIVLPKPITLDEYNTIAVKDPSEYYFIIG